MCSATLLLLIAGGLVIIYHTKEDIKWDEETRRWEREHEDGGDI
jgi:hypothetical protein